MNLADLLEQESRELAERFATRAHASSAAASLSRQDVRDSAREFVVEIAQSVRDGSANARAATRVQPSRNETAKTHGAQRFTLGYEIGGVIREYGLMFDVILELIEERGGVLGLEDLGLLARRFIHATADAATEYASVRDLDLQRLTARHIGFLAHELRNPLATARLSLQLGRRTGELSDSSSLQRAENALDRLNAQIDRALTDVRLLGAAELSFEDVGVAELLQGLAVEVAPDAEARALRVAVDAVDVGVIRGDPRVLRSAISNLVRNAVKFTREGGSVHLRARRDGSRVYVEVEDECGGIGEQVEKLFDPFVQIGGDRSGFGLGLAIAKQAALAHSGEIRVHDLPGRGCVFLLDLPVAGPSPPQDAA